MLLTISVVIKRLSRNVTLSPMMGGAPHTLSHTVESTAPCQGVSAALSETVSLVLTRKSQVSQRNAVD